MDKPSGGNTKNSVLGPFVDFLNDYKTLLGTMVGLGTTAAIASMVTAIGPPWPNPSGVAAISAVASMVWLAFTFLAWRGQTDASYLGRMKLAVGLTAGFAIIYIILWASQVYDVNGSKVVGGFTVIPDVQKVMKQDGGSLEEMMKGEEGNPYKIWTRDSIIVSKVALLAAWILFFCGISFVLTTLIMALEARKAREGTQAWGQIPKP